MRRRFLVSSAPFACTASRRAEFTHPSLILLQILLGHALVAFADGLGEVLRRHRQVHLLGGQLPDLLRFHAGDFASHRHHASVTAHIRDVGARVSLQLARNALQVDARVQFHFAQIDLEQRLATFVIWQRDINTLFEATPQSLVDVLGKEQCQLVSSLLPF